MEILFIITTIVFFALSVALFYISYKSLLLNRKYENFYNSTLEDIMIVSNSIDTIIKNRPLLSDDPDVHRMIRGIKIIQDIVSEYGQFKKTGREERTEVK